MTAQLTAQKISNYLCSVRSTHWRGTQANFVINFAEQARLYDETSTEPYTSQQKIQFPRRVWNSNLSKFSRYTTLPPRPLESNPPTPSRMLRRY
jgi:hypothetical protein